MLVCMRWISVWDRRDLSVTDVSLSVIYNMCEWSFCPCSRVDAVFDVGDDSAEAVKASKLSGKWGGGVSLVVRVRPRSPPWPTLRDKPRSLLDSVLLSWPSS